MSHSWCRILSISSSCCRLVTVSVLYTIHCYGSILYSDIKSRNIDFNYNYVRTDEKVM